MSAVASGSIEYLLVDDQTNLIDETPRKFRRFVMRIANEQGLQDSSSISMTYNPAYETIRVHSLMIHRDGVVKDRLAGAELQVYQRETELERQLYNGTLTVHTVLDDLRVGDIVEYSYSIEGLNPIFGGRYSAYFGLQWPMTLARHSLRIITSPDQPVRLEVSDGIQPFQAELVDGKLDYRWVRENVPALYPDSETPSWYDPFPGLYLSEFSNWPEVYQWASELFDAPTEPDPEVQALAETIAAQNNTPEERLEAALEFVQRDIRYVGIELGAGSHRPTSPEVTLARRFGDCKDKTLLLNTLLGQMGIRANAVLVNTELKQEILALPASPLLFDHVITRAEIDGRVYWLDATRTHQRGKLAARTPVAAGAGLVLGSGQTEPVWISPAISKAAQPGQYITQIFELPESNNEPAILRIKTVFTGDEADYMRARVAQSGEEFHRDYLNYYEELYPGIETVSHTSYQDDNAQNRVTIEEHYQVPTPWVRDDQAATDSFWLDGDLVSNFVQAPVVRNRQAPYALYHPLELRHDLIVELGHDWYLPAEHEVVQNPAFDYSRNVEYDGQHLVVSHYYQSKADHVPASATAKYLTDLERVDNLRYYGLEKRLGAAPAEEQELPPSTLFLWLGIATLLIVLVFVIYEYVRDRRREAEIVGGSYYPVSLGKFIYLNLATLGLFAVFWGYRNWRYIKHRDDSDMWPWARALFVRFTLYGLYQDARENVSATGRLWQGNVWLICLCAGYLVTGGLVRTTESWGLVFGLLLLGTLCLLPLQKVINGLEGNEERYRFNSRLRIRHGILGVVITALTVLGVASENYFLPPSHVIAGPDVPGHVSLFLKRQQMLESDERVLQFYSDAVFDYKADGSGLTNKGVFSYWDDDYSGFQVEKARFTEIADIDVAKGDFYSPTVVTITRQDGSYFLLLLGTEDSGDEGFVSVLNNRWLSAK
ncbi:MAG: DUF3857 domain-containing transglutaminase family protein [Marinobacter sp.]|nr:DUF3857 domain-containing transglutaminase family protein [Marinobacter sp.]